MAEKSGRIYRGRNLEEELSFTVDTKACEGGKKMYHGALKDEALKIHEEALREYNDQCEKMELACTALYNERCEAATLIKKIENVINTIANTPKRYSVSMGEIERNLDTFHKTDDYARQAYKAAVAAGVTVAGGAAAGLGVATAAPTLLKRMARTFGVTRKGAKISALSGRAAKKAELAWLGRTFVKPFVRSGTNITAGKALLSFASGPAGWFAFGTVETVSMVSQSKKNRDVADSAMREVEKIEIACGKIVRTMPKIDVLKETTAVLSSKLAAKIERLQALQDMNYVMIDENSQLFLGAMVNNTKALSALLNKSIDEEDKNEKG